MTGIVIPPTLFFLKVAEDIWGLFWFHINFWNICSRSVKHTIVIVIGIALNLYIALSTMDSLKIVVLPIHEYVYVSIYLYVPQFLSSGLYSFLSTGL